MIKPVYFGNSREDKFLLRYVNKIENFSDWVKNKLCEEFDVKMVGKDNIKGYECLNTSINRNSPENIIESIVDENKPLYKNDKIDDNDDSNGISNNNNGINIDQWTL